MLCPTCKSEKFARYQHDPLLMACEDCHSIHSAPWGIGFWQGHIDGERETKDKLTEIIKDFRSESERFWKQNTGNSVGRAATYDKCADRIEQLVRELEKESPDVKTTGAEL